jgi:Holliday junction resolvase RusA-like endonuclease
MIDGSAVAKGRARFTRAGFAYTPAKTRKYEAHGRLAAQLAMGNRPPITGPVHLTTLIELPIPASWSKRRSAAAIVGQIRPTSRPDLDNYLKSAMDAICGIVIADDSLVVKVTAEKKFGVDPKLVLLITPLGAMASNRGASR